MAAALLAWYDRHARALPWRVGPAARRPGLKPDPYRVWLSEIMLQQTTVAVVTPRFGRFIARWPDVAALAAAPEAEVMAEWAGLGYYARARNLIRTARAVAASGGCFPATEAGLRSLPGIGAYTAAAIAAIAFDEPATVVDGNVERVMARLFAVEEPLPGAKPILGAHAERLTPRTRPGEHAEALMDLGATICTPRAPACGECPLAAGCLGRALGVAAELPRRDARAPKPARRGLAFVARRADGAVLLTTRPERGLLGGMLALPASDFAPDPGPAAPPLPAQWREAGSITHVFTHFRLTLAVLAAEVAAGTAAPEGTRFAPPDPSALPAVMQKALAAGLAALGDLQGPR